MRACDRTPLLPCVESGWGRRTPSRLDPDPMTDGPAASETGVRFNLTVSATVKHKKGDVRRTGDEEELSPAKRASRNSPRQGGFVSRIPGVRSLVTR